MLSEFSGELLATMAPLLVIFRGGSETEVGLTMGATAAALMIMALPAGVIADRLELRMILIVAQTCRLFAVASLSLALLFDQFHLSHLVAVMLLEGVLTAVFAPAEHSALSRVVPGAQLRSAIAVNVGRPFIAALLAPVLAGYAFEFNEALPAGLFVLLILFSLFGLLRLRLPPISIVGVVGPTESVVNALVAGLRWVLTSPGVRSRLIWMLSANSLLHILIILAVLGVSGAGGSGSDVGMIMAGIGLGGVLGGLAAPRLVQQVRPGWLLAGLAVAISSSAGAVWAVLPTQIWISCCLALAAVLAPPVNAVVVSFVLESADLSMRGRASSAAAFLGNGSSALGPVFGGLAAGVWGVPPVLLAVVVAGALLALSVVALPSVAKPRSSNSEQS
jgi:MFS family permease